MKKSIFTNRIFAAVLALMISVTMTGGSFLEAFAEEGAEPAANETEAVTEKADAAGEDKQAAEESTQEEAQKAGAAESGDAANKDAAKNSAENESTDAQQNDVSTEGTLVEAAPELIVNDAANEEPAVDPQAETNEETPLAKITVKAAGDENFITAVWSEVEDTAYYMVYLDDDETGVKVGAAEGVKRRYIFQNVSDGKHTVKVQAFRSKTPAPADGTEITELPDPAQEEFELVAEGEAEDINAVIRRKLGSSFLPANYTGLSLRALIGEGNGGYAVAQGAASDGTNNYFLMVSSSNQDGRVVVTNKNCTAYLGCSGVLDIAHGNGMTYDTKRKKLVAVGYNSARNRLYFIDPHNNFALEKKNLKYSYVDQIKDLPDGAENNGIAAISYIEKYDVYVARSRGKDTDYPGTISSTKNDIWIFNAETLEAIGHVYVKISGTYPGTYQSMDADEKYVYYLLSEDGDKQPNNMILALDWNSENLLPLLNEEGVIEEGKFVDQMWYAKNDNSGTADAVLLIPTSNEVEGLFHNTDSNGESHFYMSEYYGRWAYKTVTKKYKVKKKWKKVRKWYNKKTKKWTTKKPKKKYRGKSKKVWKYKYKTKKKKVTEKDYWARDDYVYDLGTF